MQNQKVTTLKQSGNRQAHNQGMGELRCAIVTSIISDDAISCTWQNDNPSKPFIAYRAFSCLISAEKNDLVLLYKQNNQHYFLSILQRSQITDQYNESTTAHLSLPGLQPMTINSQQLTLNGRKALKLQSQNDLSITALKNIKLTASNLFSTLSQSLIQLAQHHIVKAEQIALTANQLLRSHGHHHLISADEDVKIDGERINMG